MISEGFFLRIFLVNTVIVEAIDGLLISLKLVYIGQIIING